jgi:ATP/maltotriose-dependent transcriptional regulator MalT
MVMASPLLETKLFIPTRRRGLVARPRLSERLNRGTRGEADTHLCASRVR